MTQLWEIENFLEVRDSQLHMEGANMVALAREYGTPLFVFSESRIRHNIARLEKIRDVIGCRLKICYAAKAMSTMAILRTVKEAGCDIEVNSGGELWKALEIGFRGDQIIFNGTSKEVWEIENAIKAEIYAIQVDSLYELSMIEQTAKRLGKRANVSLRLVPEIESDTHSGLQTALVTSKFGMMPSEAFSAFRDHKDSAQLSLCGIHLHVGSQNPDPVVYTQALELLYRGVKQIFAETGKALGHINIGGGFPVNYLRNEGSQAVFPNEQRQMFCSDFEPVDALHAAWQSVREDIGGDKNWDLMTNITLTLEPGRSIIADTGICLTTVRNSKSRPIRNGISSIDDSEHAENWLLTDAGFNILLSMETYKWYYHIISAERAGEEHDFPYKLAGPLCDGGDVYFDHEGHGRLPDHRLLPPDLKPGDVLALLNCGAYSLAQASQYNGRFLPAVVLIRENGSPELVRKRDDFESLTANDIF